MAVGLIGADADELDRLALAMRSAGDRLHDIDTRLVQAVRAMRWQGADAARFQSSWPGESARLRAAASALDAASTQLHREALEQRLASDSSTVSVGAALASGALLGIWTKPGGWSGLTGSAETQGHGSLGPVDWSAGGDVETFAAHAGSEAFAHGFRYDPVTHALLPAAVGASAFAAYNVVALGGQASARLGAAELEEKGSFSVGARSNAGAGASLGPDGVEGHVDAGASIGARADASADARLGLLEAKAGGSGMAGAEATAGAGFSGGTDGAGAHAAVDAFAGARAEGSAGGSLAGQGASVSGHVTAGFELKAGADVELGLDKVELSANFGAAFGIGAGGGVKIELSPSEAARHLGSFTHLW